MHSQIQDNRGPWLWTHSGARFWPLSPRAEDIRLADLAHSLSCINRFGGHSREPYSVAQHSVLVSELCHPRDAWQGLFHDAAEAYVNDLPSPIKHLAALQGYRDIEAGVNRALSYKYKLCWVLPVSVKHADGLVCEAEMRDLLPGYLNTIREPDGIILPCPELDSIPEIRPWPWFYAKEMWLRRYYELGGQPE